MTQESDTDCIFSLKCCHLSTALDKMLYGQLQLSSSGGDCDASG